MRVNVYTEELYTLERPFAEIVTAEYVSSRTGETMKKLWPAYLYAIGASASLHSWPR